MARGKRPRYATEPGFEPIRRCAFLDSDGDKEGNNRTPEPRSSFALARFSQMSLSPWTDPGEALRRSSGDVARDAAH